MRLTRKTVSEETRRKLSLAGKGINNPFYGKHHSKETKLKISLANKGREISEETRRKLSRCHIGNTNRLGKHHSKETKDKISNFQKGKITSDETKRKMSIAAKNVIKLKCPYCGKECKPGTAKRWHFENCKYNFNL